MDLHEDFAHLTVVPGSMEIDGNAGNFGLTNLLAFGGAADRQPHVPATVGAVDNVVIWESTGASDALPFWNTNFSSDVYLYLVEGEVRVEFKLPETDQRLGHYDGRTGDLMRLPRAIAHRTFAASGRRRISMEILQRNPWWLTIGRHADVKPASSPVLEQLRFVPDGDVVRIVAPEGEMATPAGFLIRGLRALLAYELHLDHNEFENGFVVHDHGGSVRIKTSVGHDGFYEPSDVLAVFKSLIRELDQFEPLARRKTVGEPGG